MAGGARLEGDPILCRDCYGAGLRPRGVDDDPCVCRRCNGEGIEHDGRSPIERRQKAAPFL